MTLERKIMVLVCFLCAVIIIVAIGILIHPICGLIAACIITVAGQVLFVVSINRELREPPKNDTPSDKGGTP